MNREQFDHIVRASADVLGEDAVVVIGSQAFVGLELEGVPLDAMVSIEVDVMPVSPDPDGEKALRLAGALGEFSPFHESFGIYVDGVEAGLARFPAGWRDRLVPYSSAGTAGKVALCADIDDVCVAKLLAGRDKDLRYVRALVQSGHAHPVTMLDRLASTNASTVEQARFAERLRAMAGERRAVRKALRRLDNRAEGPTASEQVRPRLDVGREAHGGRAPRT